MTKLQYMHYRPATTDSRGGATVAILPIYDNKVLISISRCGPSDMFNRKIGRSIAAGRLRAFMDGREKVVSMVREVSYDDPFEIKQAVGEELYKEMASKGLY